MNNTSNHFDVIVIGAGPSGAIAAALLVKKGYKVLVLERQIFPRFSIGESLLPQCMEYIEEAGMMEAVKRASFQHKDGAAFQRNGEFTHFNFAEQFSEGWSSTFQIQRADFDKILADEAEKQGADIRYEHTITGVDFNQKKPVVNCQLPDGTETKFSAEFILDGSGFGRVLARLLDLESPVKTPPRGALFTHVEDNITDERFDRNKILISVHPTRRDVWYWLIPFSNGRCSLGVVASLEYFDEYDLPSDEKLKKIIFEDETLTTIFANAKWDTPTREIKGYAVAVKNLCTDKYALLGNAGEFLDPVFSSGVTIAMRSASKATALLDRQLKGETVDWQKEYAEPLAEGVNTFKVYVNGWYEGPFQDVIFSKNQSDDVRKMICSILAGYAWDKSNPYVEKPERRLRVLAELCRG